jgi:AraC-like DNA-binding protein
VQTVSGKIKKQLEPLERFLGDGISVTDSTGMPVNNFIRADWFKVCIPGEGLPEDQGMLYLYPIGDNKFCLQLCYLQYADDPKADASVCILRFLPEFFDQYPAEVLMENQPFRFDQTTEQQFSVCAKTRALMGQLQPVANQTPFIRSLQQSEAAMNLLRTALECITIPFTVCQVPACRFLAYESEREKIMEARLILEHQLDQPMTIRELSRKVAINECYLKKGFKALTGKTIHEYQQDLRISKAKELLSRDGLSVTDVANTLGYSSISHFSTAFKRVTGMKPCELLS